MMSDDEEFDELPSAAMAKAASDERELPQFVATHASAEEKIQKGLKEGQSLLVDWLTKHGVGGVKMPPFVHSNGVDNAPSH